MSETPSNRRRKGRNAFEPGVDPMDIQPYSPGSWNFQYHLEDWLDGWKEAQATYNAREEEHEEETACGCDKEHLWYDFNLAIYRCRNCGWSQ